MPSTINRAYPRAPYSLINSWENRLQLEQSPAVDRKNGGTEFRGSGFQANRTKYIQEIRIAIVSMSSYFEIEGFLQEREGKPFFFEDILYQVLDNKWNWIYKGGSGVSAVNELSMTLKQVFRP